VSGLALRKARWQAAALAAVFKFVLFNSQARRGDRDGVTNESNPEMAKNCPRKTEQENT
jgi:hypothetical protein